MSDKYRIRLAEFAELSILNDLENAAAIIFQDTNYALEINQASLSVELLSKQQKQGLVWVAAQKRNHLVGSALILIIVDTPISMNCQSFPNILDKELVLN